jgi:DUF4097 and DUF4098 domain-containing protein YvlB
MAAGKRLFSGVFQEISISGKNRNIAMKNYLLVAAFVCGAVSVASPQKIVEKSFAVNGQKAVLDFGFADNITIEAWGKNTIELKVSANIDDNRYNDFYSLQASEGSNKIEMKEKVDFDGIKSKEGKKNLQNFNTEINYELKVPAGLEFSLKTISGKIELKGCTGKMDINSISGFIDYSIPQSHKANVDLSTISGDVYSNIDFDKQPSENISAVGTKRKLKLNGGNVPVELKTVSGDIYLRRASY